MYVQSTLQSSGVSLKFKPRVSNIYPHSKQSHMMGGVKYETLCGYIFDTLGLNFSDTPDDCRVLCTYMKRFFE